MREKDLNSGGPCDWTCRIMSWSETYISHSRSWPEDVNHSRTVICIDNSSGHVGGHYLNTYHGSDSLFIFYVSVMIACEKIKSFFAKTSWKAIFQRSMLWMVLLCWFLTLQTDEISSNPVCNEIGSFEYNLYRVKQWLFPYFQQNSEECNSIFIHTWGPFKLNAQWSLNSKALF